MTDPSAAFAAWVLGLLPRLALWPGGVALLLAGGGAWWAGRRGGGGAALPALERLALALAWAAVAFLPLPGTPPLPLAPDALVLLGLLLAATGLAGAHAPPGGGVGLCAGAVAVLAAGAGSLGLPFAAGLPLVGALAAGAYAWGLASMGAAPASGPPSILRLLLWLGWLGLGWAIPPPWNGLAVAGALVLLLALAGQPRPAAFAHRGGWIGWLALAGAVAAVLLG
jgi:hypothetical protein